jgi:uncharacterized protein (DUF58 family)
MASARSTLSQFWARADRPAVRAFSLSLFALAIALMLALYSGAAAQLGNVMLATATALGALALAAWVAVTLVPTLAKRTPLRWISYKMEYRITREGWIYIGGTLLIALAALNTGNNLLFLILACLISIILMSGILSSISLAGVELRLELPEHIFAEETVRATVELINEKLTMPSFSLRVIAAKPKGESQPTILDTPVYFPYVPRNERARQSVPLAFRQRGIHKQDAFRIVTRFPFGFLQKARQVDLKTEALVYPSVEPTPELQEILPSIEGTLESLVKGRGQDLYALRDYLPTDSVRHVHWKASARFGSLMVREFSREDDSRILLVFDPRLDLRVSESANSSRIAKERFERAIRLCAGLAWHFRERKSQFSFRSVGIETKPGPAGENIFTVLRFLATIQPVSFDPEHLLIQDLAAAPDLFKIIVTSQPRGSIPASLWSSSYVVFLEDFDPVEKHLA